MKRLLLVAALAACFLGHAGQARADGCPTDPHQLVANAQLSVVEGGQATATFTIPAGCQLVQVSLVSYTAPGPAFDWTTAHEQAVFARETDTLGPGQHTMTVKAPPCYYQADLVVGDVIEHFGLDESSPDFYSHQGRLVAASNGGSSACLPPPPPAKPHLVPPVKHAVHKAKPKRHPKPHARPHKARPKPPALPYTP